MKKIKPYFILIKSNTVLKCFLLTAFICISCIGFARPLVQGAFFNEAVTTTASKKKLPIYCVDTPEKKVAISFDAAWGAGRLRSNFIKVKSYRNICKMIVSAV